MVLFFLLLFSLHQMLVSTMCIIIIEKKALFVKQPTFPRHVTKLFRVFKLTVCAGVLYFEPSC